ncbi:Uncharacterized protein M6B38_231020 [Iris pallida]|uniref:Uncharacterized protein n=1 Tax=Iris pallida TaxID=29817 RepID=A0AAX6DQX2_IRIPA|nr:Uncharacterized protein M6B38_231020 [Iris pallida]
MKKKELSQAEREAGEGFSMEEELLGLSLRRGISLGKTGGPHTPVPAWKLEDPADAAAGPSSPAAPPRRSSAAAASARKLGASLWEVQDLGGLPLSGAHRLRRREILANPSRCQDQPQTAGSLRRHAASSSIQQHKLNRRNIQAQQPASPATYSSSMEASTVNRVISPSRSLDFKGMVREGRYNLKTSMELVKVLERIWSLEEQHTSTVLQVKELKAELKHARARIQELMYEKQTYSHEMDDLMKQIAEDTIIRKRKEQHKIKTAVQSIRDELEDERKLRRKSESLHRKLVKEISEVKAVLTKAVNDLDREKEINHLVENLCDVLAEGVRNYELEVRKLQQKTVKENDHKADRWVLHISEAWLDERLQMKIAEARGDVAERNTIVDRLHGQVVTFLQGRQSYTAKESTSHNNVTLRRQSLESVHLNGAASAPQDADDDDSIASDMHCFELNLGANDSESHDRLEPASENGIVKLDDTKMSRIRRKSLGYFGRNMGHNSNLQGEPRKLLNSTKAYDGNKMHIMDRLHGRQSHNTIGAESTEGNQVEIALSQRSKNFSPQEVGPSIGMDGMHESNLILNSASIDPDLCGVKDHHGDRHGEDRSKRCQFSSNDLNVASGDFCTLSSPGLQQNYRTPSSNPEIYECSSRSVRASKDSTLKAKLLEARLEGRHARMKAIKSSSVV